MYVVKYFFVTLFCFFLAACGGGGGGNGSGNGNGNGGNTKSKLEQTALSFKEMVLTISINDTVQNPVSGGSGTGSINYSSSNLNVANIDSSSGVIKAAAAGTTTITATKAGDDNYNQINTSFTLTVTKREQSAFTFNSYIIEKVVGDEAFTNAVFGGDGSGKVSYSSSNPDIATVNSSNGLISPLKDGEITITATKEGNDTFNTLSTSFTLVIHKKNQPALVFSSATITRPIDASPFANPIDGGGGNGLITYKSSDDTIASISPAGTITIHKSGSVVISATKAGDSIFNSTAAQFDLSITKLAQNNLTFSKAIMQKILGEPSFFNSISGGNGAGKITYTSGDENIASIDENGEITLHAKGNLVITASKAEDDTYLSNTTSFTLNVDVVATRILAEVGIENTLISWEDQGADIQLYRSSDQNCDANNIASCANSKQISAPLTNKHLVVDNYLNTTQSGYITIGTSNHLSQPMLIQKTAPGFIKRRSEELIEFKGKLFLIGGLNEENDKYNCLNDIWSTADGITWKKEKSQAAFSPRNDHRIVKFNDALWLFSGEECIGDAGASRFTNNMWKSYDGVNWTSVPISASISGKRQHTLTLFNNKLWLIGGAWEDASIWSSEDGSNWIKVISNAPFGPRSAHEVIVFNNKMWLIGGLEYPSSTSQDGLPTKNDIWSSTDGVNWTLEKANANFSPRMNHKVLNFQGKLWLIGGYANTSNGLYNETWSSVDGVNWNLESSPITPNSYWARSAALFNNKLWLHGTDAYIWGSSDGKTWRASASLTPSWKY